MLQIANAVVCIILGIFIRRLPRGQGSPPSNPELYRRPPMDSMLNVSYGITRPPTHDGRESPVQIHNGQIYGRSLLMSLLHLGFCILRLYLHSTLIVFGFCRFGNIDPST